MARQAKIDGKIYTRTFMGWYDENGAKLNIIERIKLENRIREIKKKKLHQKHESSHQKQHSSGLKSLLVITVLVIGGLLLLNCIFPTTNDTSLDNNTPKKTSVSAKSNVRKKQDNADLAQHMGIKIFATAKFDAYTGLTAAQLSIINNMRTLIYVIEYPEKIQKSKIKQFLKIVSKKLAIINSSSKQPILMNIYFYRKGVLESSLPKDDSKLCQNKKDQIQIKKYHNYHCIDEQTLKGLKVDISKSTSTEEVLAILSAIRPLWQYAYVYSAALGKQQTYAAFSRKHTADFKDCTDGKNHSASLCTRTRKN